MRRGEQLHVEWVSIGFVIRSGGIIVAVRRGCLGKMIVLTASLDHTWVTSGIENCVDLQICGHGEYRLEIIAYSMVEVGAEMPWFLFDFGGIMVVW